MRECGSVSSETVEKIAFEIDDRSTLRILLSERHKMLYEFQNKDTT